MVIRRNKSRGSGGGDDGTGDLGPLTPLQEALLKEASREIPVLSNGRSQSMLVYEAVMRKLLQTAVNGGQHAMSNVIYLINLAQRINQRQIDEKVALGRKWRALQEHLLTEARKHGRDLDLVLPHPDDIVVEEGVGYEIIGPIDETELRRVKRDCDWRDTIILQAALEERLGVLPPVPDREPSRHSANASALFVMHIVNNDLPKRFQKSDLQIVMELMRYEVLTKRELLKRAYRKWASLGQPKPRGWRLPPLETLVSMVERVLPAMIAVYPDAKDPKVSVNAIAKKLERLIGPEPFG